MSPSNDYPFYLLRKFILSCVLFRLSRSTVRTLTLLCTRENSHTASHLLTAYTTPGGIFLTSLQVPLSSYLHSHRSLLSIALACPFFSVASQFNFTLIYSTPLLLDSIPLLRRSAPCRSLSIHLHRTSPPRLSAPYYSHISPTVNTSLQYSPLTLILPPCFPIPSCP